MKLGWMGELGGSGGGEFRQRVGATNGATKQVWARRWQREDGLDGGVGRERRGEFRTRDGCRQRRHGTDPRSTSLTGSRWTCSKSIRVEYHARKVGDIDGDTHVDMVDLLLAGSWAKSTGEDGYDAACDLDHDGSVDVVDLMMLAGDWGAQDGGGDQGARGAGYRPLTQDELAKL